MTSLPEERFSLVPAGDPAGEALSQLPAVPADFKAVDEWFDPARDLIVPRLSLLQAMSAEVQTESGVSTARPGFFYNSMTQEVYTPPLAVVVVRTAKTAVFFGDTENGEEPCRSSDMLHGSVYGECKTCPRNWACWSENGGRRIPPRCHETIAFLLIPPRSTAPLLFSCMKTGLPAARALVNQRRSVLSTFLRNWWDRPVLLGAKKLTGEKGFYYVPTLGFDAAHETDEVTRRLAFDAWGWSEKRRIVAEEPEGLNGG